jgi:hypothetical protein
MQWLGRVAITDKHNTIAVARSHGGSRRLSTFLFQLRQLSLECRHVIMSWQSRQVAKKAKHSNQLVVVVVVAVIIITTGHVHQWNQRPIQRW